MTGREPDFDELRSDPLGSTKILPHHLERLAIVYVRQSTLQQTLKNQESTRLQYGLVQRAQQPAGRVGQAWVPAYADRVIND